MNEIKKGYREAEETAKETWRKADGEEDLADKVGNLGDDVRKELGNLGDNVSDAVNDAGRKIDRNTDLPDDRPFDPNR